MIENGAGGENKVLTIAVVLFLGNSCEMLYWFVGYCLFTFIWAVWGVCVCVFCLWGELRGEVLDISAVLSVCYYFVLVFRVGTWDKLVLLYNGFCLLSFRFFGGGGVGGGVGADRDRRGVGWGGVG